MRDVDGGMVDGLLLAALLGGHDASAERALDAPLARALDARRAALPSDRDGRARAGAQLARGMRPAPPADLDAPPRARALLAAEASREVGARWLADAGATRRGYVADDALRAAVRALAVPPPDPAVARTEHGRGRAWLAAARTLLGDAHHAALLDAAGAEEAAAALALAAMPGEAALAGGATLAAAVAREASRVAHGTEIVRALGALALGAAGEAGGDARSRRWRETGAEIRRAVALREESA